MKITMNLKGNFVLVPEGERVLTITKAECTPSGKPNKLKVTFQDTESGYINSQYDFTNEKALFGMAKLLEAALGFEDGDEFDTKTDTDKLVGKKLLCEVVHTQGTKPNDKGELPTFANIKRTIELVDGETGEVGEISPRNSITSLDDDEDDLD